MSAVAALLSGALAGAPALSEACPPSHALLEDGTCQIVTLYDFYASPAGHGGVRVPLPPVARRYTPEVIDLGRLLFFDPVLSVNRDMSCATCHRPDEGFSDGRRRAMGTRELDRSTPSLWNVAFLNRFTWDGRAETLEDQAAIPLLAPDEMGHSEEGLEQALRDVPAYVSLFHQAFEGPPSLGRVATALAAFQSSLVSFDSRYDRYAHGDAEAMTPQEIRGYNAFRGFVGRCSQCHVPPLFTDSELAVVGAPADDRGYADPGAASWSTDPSRLGAFKVPTLRNVTRTAPYFHAGQLEDLDAVLRFYNDTRGHAAPSEQDLDIHWHVHLTRGPQLSEQAMADIVAFLGALEDEHRRPAIPERVPSGLAPLTGLRAPIRETSP